MRTLASLAVSTLALVACSSTPAPPAGPQDAAADTSVDDAALDSSDAAPAPHYPAFAPAMTQLINHKGGVLDAPKIVTITWSIDPNAAYYESFDDTIGASDYWKATTSEYGVGPAVSGGHVSIKTPPPKTMQDSDLDAYIATQVANAPASGWPVNDGETLYLLYLPEVLKLTLGGNTQCNSGVGGYHTETSANGQPVIYGIVGLECHNVWGEGVTQFATHVGSHELTEAVTDPHVQTAQGWVGYDSPHWAWAELLQHTNENGDACEWFSDSTVALTKPNFWVQRTWSNVAAKGGHNPCVPINDTYFSVTPLDMVDINVVDENRKIPTKGYSMAVGVQSSIDVGFYSDAPLAAWPIEVVEGSPFGPKSAPTLTIAGGNKSGKDGDIATIYITPNFPSPPSGTLVTVISSGTAKHYMPFLIKAK